MTFNQHAWSQGALVASGIRSCQALYQQPQPKMAWHVYVFVSCLLKLPGLISGFYSVYYNDLCRPAPQTLPQLVAGES